MLPVLPVQLVEKKQPEPALSALGLNLLVFRDGRRQMSGVALQRALARQITSLQRSYSPREILTALLQAGELECALADSGASSPEVEKITDAAAEALIGGTAPQHLNELLAALDRTCVPQSLSVSIPEGFAFYALHPLAYSDVLQEFSVLPARALVIGIRSIGTTLSAVTAAALRARGVHATRMTVRPTGHPYNRVTRFSQEELVRIKRAIAGSGMFFIVDEGPGLSGSSFLSVAEALVEAGASQEKITLLCSHAADPDHLCADNAGTRWRQFRSVVVPSFSRRPEDAQIWSGGGEWRRHLLSRNSEWPSSWLSFERLKYLSGWNTAPRFYKFSGFGGYGKTVLQREEQISAAGFGPEPRVESDGYLSYPLLAGESMSAKDLSPTAMARMAEYCAFRARAFPCESADVIFLEGMAVHNLQQMKCSPEVKLASERAVIPDGRMHPHEWRLTSDGRMLKTDSGSHGDDHFFPGPCDIVWDLAGAIVEWQMNREQAANFLDMYRRASGDDAQSRIAGYLTAYVSFRWAYCTMAANAMRGTEEEHRLLRDAARYRDFVIG